VSSPKPLSFSDYLDTIFAGPTWRDRCVTKLSAFLESIDSWLVMPRITGALLNSVPGHLAGIAGGVFNTSRQSGGALAVAVFRACLPRRRPLCKARAPAC
jgi:hypothetical protein